MRQWWGMRCRGHRLACSHHQNWEEKKKRKKSPAANTRHTHANTHVHARLHWSSTHLSNYITPNRRHGFLWRWAILPPQLVSPTRDSEARLDEDPPFSSRTTKERFKDSRHPVPDVAKQPHNRRASSMLSSKLQNYSFKKKSSLQAEKTQDIQCQLKQSSPLFLQQLILTFLSNFH